METTGIQNHFVLVHGACHGAWCWFKIKPRLESAGHRVTALDLSASGTNTRKIDEISTLYDYTLPLLEFLEAIPAGEKVILVGHSLGGLSLALAMDMYPSKVTVGAFLAAFMPDSAHAPSYVLDKDISLGKLLIRTGSLFLDDLSNANKFTVEGYGSIKRVYIVCAEDLAIPEEYQRWMIENSPVNEVKEIKGSDHMPMLSKPEQLSHCLLDIANGYDR